MPHKREYNFTSCPMIAVTEKFDGRDGQSRVRQVAPYENYDFHRHDNGDAVPLHRHRDIAVRAEKRNNSREIAG